MPLDYGAALRPSKHFQNTWMRKWDWDVNDLREALREAYKTEKVGKAKYELYTRYKSGGRSRKLILVDYGDELFIITGAEGA